MLQPSPGRLTRDMDIPEQPIVGVTDALIPVDGRADNRALAAAMATQAQRSIDILTPDLESAVYDDRAFLDAVTRLSTRSRFSLVRVLVCDSTAAVKRGHRLIELARRVSSSILLHNPDREHQDLREGFLVVDGRAYLYKNLAERYKGEANFQGPLRARELTKTFNELWDISAPDVQLRRLHI